VTVTPIRPPPPPEPRRDDADDPVARMIIPIGRSGWAIAAGYLGLLSPLPVFAPLALATGVLALRDIRRDPKKLGKGRAIFGIVMGALFSPLLVAIVWSVVARRLHH
jgi:hypothetical protein